MLSLRCRTSDDGTITIPPVLKRSKTLFRHGSVMPQRCQLVVTPEYSKPGIAAELQVRCRRCRSASSEDRRSPVFERAYLALPADLAVVFGMRGTTGINRRRPVAAIRWLKCSNHVAGQVRQCPSLKRLRQTTYHITIRQNWQGWIAPGITRRIQWMAFHENSSGSCRTCCYKLMGWALEVRPSHAMGVKTPHGGEKPDSGCVCTTTHSAQARASIAW